MEPGLGPADVLAHLPSWSALYRVAPISTWTVALVALGYWVGRRSRDGEVAALERGRT